MRQAAGLSFVADHLAQFEGRATPLVDAVLAEIEANRKVERGQPGKVFVVEEAGHEESKEPGIGPGDVFRIFGNNANGIITDANWQEIPEARRREILDEAEDWRVPKTLGLDESLESQCSHCKSPYAKRVKRTYANGKSDFCCHSCGRALLGLAPKQRDAEALT